MDTNLDRLEEIAFELLELEDERDELILEAYNEGCTMREIAEALDVSVMTIQRTINPSPARVARLLKAANSD